MGGLAHVLEADRRYWVHAGFVGLALASSAIVFWAYWSYHSATWDLLRFVTALVQLGTVYFLATTLVPENAREVESWRDYYESVRVRYFSGLIVCGLMTALVVTLMVAMPVVHPARLTHAWLVIVGVIGVSTPNPRVHAGLAISGLRAFPIVAATVFLRAGSLAG
ncbi:MAG: hypothetical protein H6993_18975 [Pseudomonadales bacterium]|nr:hypothetical protein [Pseudomonadales bacterium]